MSNCITHTNHIFRGFVLTKNNEEILHNWVISQLEIADEIAKVALENGSSSSKLEYYQVLQKVTETVTETGVNPSLTAAVLRKTAAGLHSVRAPRSETYIEMLLEFHNDHPDALYCQAKTQLSRGELLHAYRSLSIACLSKQVVIHKIETDPSFAASLPLLYDYSEILELRNAVEYVMNVPIIKPSDILVKITEYMETVSPFSSTNSKLEDALLTDEESEAPESFEESDEIGAEIDE